MKVYELHEQILKIAIRHGFHVQKIDIAFAQRYDELGKESEREVNITTFYRYTDSFTNFGAHISTIFADEYSLEMLMIKYEVACKKEKFRNEAKKTDTDDSFSLELDTFLE